MLFIWYSDVSWHKTQAWRRTRSPFPHHRIGRVILSVLHPFFLHILFHINIPSQYTDFPLGEPLLPTGTGGPAHSSVSASFVGAALCVSCGLSWGAVGLWAGCVVRGMCAQLVHFNGCRDHSKSAPQIINVFLNFNPLWYLAFKVFFFFLMSA